MTPCAQPRIHGRCIRPNIANRKWGIEMQYRCMQGGREAPLRTGSAITAADVPTVKARGETQFATLCAAPITMVVLVTLTTAVRGQTVVSAQEWGAASLEPIIVTARLRKEEAQAVPISLSVVDSATIERTFSNNISQISLLVPSINYTSPNPRNTALTIRGLGSSVVAIAQANDGLDPGVGFYVDQVYHGRPATAAFDFVDLDRIEVLRGPQGTVFGKNTTAGAINITTKAPSFTFEGEGELSYGAYNYRQGKVSVSGPLMGDMIAGRLSLVSTTRDGVIRNVNLGGWDNGLNDQ